MLATLQGTTYSKVDEDCLRQELLLEVVFRNWRHAEALGNLAERVRFTSKLALSEQKQTS